MDDQLELFLTERQQRQQQLTRAAVAGVFVLLGAWTLKEFYPALAWAAVLAVAVWPFYRRVQRLWPKGRHKILLPLAFTLAVALIFVVPLGLIVMQIGREAHTIADWARDAQANGIAVPDVVQRLPFGGPQITTWWTTNLTHPHDAESIFRQIGQSGTVEMTGRLGTQVVRRIVIFGFTLLSLFVLFREGSDVTRQMLRASHRALGPSGERIARQVVRSVHGTVNGLVLVGLGEGVVMGLVYSFCGVPRPTILGAVTAVAAIVPFGAPVASGFAVLLLLAQSAVVPAIVVAASCTVVVFIADHFIRPVLIGGATRLPFLWVLLGILGGLEAWGLLGLFVGPAIMAVLILLWREWVGEPHNP
jgi:predicted PurR-regulated permease PerM